jgi:hypothetical protein
LLEPDTCVERFVVGLDSAREDLSGLAESVSLFGNAVGIYLLLLYSMGFAEYFSSKSWQRIGIRILGSWMAASAFLVLALMLSPVATQS